MNLTQSMQPVIESIGFDAALAFVGRFKGTRIWIPKAPDGSDDVSLAIGVEAARKLSRDIGFGPLDVPFCQNWVLARRDEEIALRAERGESKTDIARSHNISRRRVHQIVKVATEGQTP